MKLATMEAILSTYSFFDDLIDIIDEGKFIAPDQDLILGEGIELLGEMNTLEKALYTLACQYGTEMEAVMATISKDEHPFLKIAMKGKYDLLKNKARNAMSHLWISIKERLAKKYYEIKSDKNGEIGLGIYSDFSIKVLIREPSADDGIEGVMSILGRVKGVTLRRF